MEKFSILKLIIYISISGILNKKNLTTTDYGGWGGSRGVSDFLVRSIQKIPLFWRRPLCVLYAKMENINNIMPNFK